MNISLSNYIQPNTPALKTLISDESVHSAASISNQTSPTIPIPSSNSQSNLQDVSKALEEVNKKLQLEGIGIEFATDEDSKKTIVKVIDTQTNDVIRQYPSEAIIEISKALEKLQGLLVDERA